MIWRVMQSSANDRNDVSLSAEVANGLEQADLSLLDEVVASHPREEVRARLQADKPLVAADDVSIARSSPFRAAAISDSSVGSRRTRRWTAPQHSTWAPPTSGERGKLKVFDHVNLTFNLSFRDGRNCTARFRLCRNWPGVVASRRGASARARRAGLGVERVTQRASATSPCPAGNVARGAAVRRSEDSRALHRVDAASLGDVPRHGVRRDHGHLAAVVGAAIGESLDDRVGGSRPNMSPSCARSTRSRRSRRGRRRHRIPVLAM